MIDFDLSSIPDHLLVKVIQKSNALSFVKFLRSARKVSEVCYKNKRTIKIRPTLCNFQIVFDVDESKKKYEEYEVEYRFRKHYPKDSNICGFNVTTSAVVTFDEFLDFLEHLTFFNFKCISFSEKLESPEAISAIGQVIEKMKSFRMRTKELEMYNNEICNRAIDVLKPRSFRSDFQEGKLMVDCITKETLDKIEYLDYFSDNVNDAKGVMAHILPNCRFLDCCFDFKCDWIWDILRITIQNIRRGSIPNNRLSLSVFDTDLPKFEQYFENIPHRVLKYPAVDQNFIFVDCIGSLSAKIAIITTNYALCESFHYSLVRSFADFCKFYCDIFHKEKYDLDSVVRVVIFGE